MARQCLLGGGQKPMQAAATAAKDGAAKGVQKDVGQLNYRPHCRQDSHALCVSSLSLQSTIVGEELLDGAHVVISTQLKDELVLTHSWIVAQLAMPS